ncbi:hypothetical protein [Amniculibacterium sp. G2-70]|uniref:hypothetical protein n=1 Tax=Amniculibacterium sp. G2-70 TaxID=2767188 RepID=UPI001654BF1B|nr:hypothetical protein [Amniculibacterium sp. G2-70]
MKSTILILTTFFLLACKERSNEEEKPYDPQLPPITMVGANTFGCKINGVVMVPRNSIGYVPPGSNHYPVWTQKGIDNEYKFIQAADLRETKRGGVFLYLQNTVGSTIFQSGDYPIFDGITPSYLNDNYNNYIYVTVYKNGVANNYKSIAGTGKITLSVNSNLICSGTFNCKAKNVNDPNDIIEITDGRFDFGVNINTTNFP